jgi:hypothetical protein
MPVSHVSSEWHTVAYPAADRRATLVEQDSDGTERLDMGGLRAEIRGNNVVFAEEGLLDDIGRSCRSGSGWIHVTHRGIVYESRTFLSHLEPLGAAGSGGYAGVRQCGPVVVINDESGTPEIWSHFDRRALPALKDVLAFRFSSPTKARAIAWPDRLLQSEDGGRTLYASASHAEDFDSPTDWLGTDSTPKNTEAKQQTMERLLAAYAHHSVESDVGALVGGLSLNDGTRIRDAGGYWLKGKGPDSIHKQFIALRRPDGTIVDTELEGACHLLAWGNKLLAHCYEGEPGLRVVYPLDAPPIPEPPLRPRFVFADPDGRYVVSEPWPEDDYETVSQKLIHFDGVSWRVIEKANGDLSNVRGKWLLMLRPTRLVPIAQPEATGIPLDTGEALGCEIQLLDDSVVFIRRREPRYGPNATAELVHAQWGPAGLTEEAAYPIALTVQSIAFADALHGVAGLIGQDSVVTTDGGRTWKPLEGAQLGLNRSLREPRCSSDTCFVRGTLAFTRRTLAPAALADFGHPMPEPRRKEVASTQQDANASEASPSCSEGCESERTGDPGTPPSYECRARPKASKQSLMPMITEPPPGRMGPTPGGGFHFTRLAAQGGVFEKLEAPQRFTWKGYDADGAFTVSAPVVDDKANELWQQFGRSLLYSPMVVPLVITRNFALIDYITDDASEAVVLHADGRLESFPATRWAVGAWLLSKGDIEVHLLHTGSRDAPSYLEVLAFDPGGERTARRWFVSSAGSAAWGPSGPGLVDVHGDQLEYRPLKSETAPTVFAVPTRLAACAKPSQPDAITYYGTFLDISVDGARAEPLITPTHMAPGSTAVGLVETSSSGACLRGIEVSTPYALTLSADKGTLRGILIGPSTNHEVTCRQSKR